jgi:hypothetical protein
VCDRVPIPTSTLATYLRYGGSDPHIAGAVYGLVVEGVALTSFAITPGSSDISYSMPPFPCPPRGRAAVCRRRRRNRARNRPSVH